MVLFIFLWNLVLVTEHSTTTMESRALPFFHAFTSCDTTSTFYGHGKCSFWDSWMKNEEISELSNTFIELSDIPEMVTPLHVDIIQRYLIKVYYPQESILSLTDLRLKYYFKRPDPQLKSLIISRDGLTNHSWLDMETC